MKYCLKCGTEYLDTIEKCADCDEPLVGQERWTAMLEAEKDRREELRDVDMTVACSVDGRVEALSIKGMLEAESIPVLLRTYEETAFDGLFVGPKGWGQIWVAASSLEQARALIKAFRKSPTPDLSGQE